MSSLLELQERLQETSAAIAILERAVAANPSSPSLVSMGKSLTKRRQELEAEFLEQTNSLGVDICTYRLFGDHDNVTIAALSKSLGDFQTLVSLVYESIKYTLKKARARISSLSALQTSFHFGYSFPGSLGIVLTIPNERPLFDESSLDQSIQMIFQMAQARETSTILEYAKQLGVAPVRAMYDWAYNHAQYRLGVDIEWRRGNVVSSKLLIQRPELEELYETIGATSQETSELLVMEGILVGSDVDRHNKRSFHMRLQTGEEIRGTFSEAIEQGFIVQLPKQYRATVTKKSRLQLSTGEETMTYVITKLEPIDGLPNQQEPGSGKPRPIRNPTLFQEKK